MAPFFVAADIAQAHTLVSDFYTSPTYYEASKKHIFLPTWQFAGHSQMVATAGYAYPFVLLEGCLDEPLLLTSGLDGTLNCISNVCTHRGNLLVNAPCAINRIRCRYHGRQFAPDGTFVSMPEFAEVVGFPAPSDNLPKLPLHQWGSLLFTAVSPTLQPSSFLGDMAERLSWMDLSKLQYRPDLSKDYEVQAHWALYCENYLEGFHIPFVHAGLNQELDFGEYTTELFRYSNLQLGIGRTGDDCFELQASSPDYGKQVAAYYFWVFPNMMFNFYPWGLSVNVVQPTGIGSCKVSFITFVSDESRLDKGAGSGLHTVELEDEEVVQQVQKGIRSRLYSQGRYSVTREQGTHHFHRLIAEFMNAEL